MQTIRSIRNNLEAQLASGMPVGAGVTVVSGAAGAGFAHGANLCLTVSGMSGMQCSGSRIFVPGDDV